MDECEEIRGAAARLRPQQLDELSGLLAWIAAQPESAEEECEKAIEAFAKSRG